MVKKARHTFRTELVSIGTELVKGEHEDNNSPYLSAELLKIGLPCNRFTTVADFPLPPLVREIQSALKRTDLLILSGGLGPTEDDVTRQAIAKALRKKLIFSSALFQKIERRFQRRHLAMPKINARQAFLPQGGKAIPNPLGSAPGILVEKGKKVLISLPGVPQELEKMFEKSVRPYLKRRFPGLPREISVLLHTTGLAESRVNELLEDLIRKEKKIVFGFYAHPGVVTIKLTTHPQEGRLLKKAEKEIRQRLGSSLFGEKNENLEETVFRLLEKKRMTVSVAESCTGGALSLALTRIPGSSRHFKMGVVAYRNDTKSVLLKIPKKMIQTEGAVSESVAKALARQAQRIGKTDWGLGVTGILGPGGGTGSKPVGLVYIGLSSAEETTFKKFYFTGNREAMRLRVVKAALDLLRRELLRQ